MAEYKTPGIYIKERNVLSSSVVEAETAIPVFIGLTEKLLTARNPCWTGRSGFHRWRNMRSISGRRKHTDSM